MSRGVGVNGGCYPPFPISLSGIEKAIATMAGESNMVRSMALALTGGSLLLATQVHAQGPDPGVHPESVGEVVGTATMQCEVSSFVLDRRWDGNLMFVLDTNRNYGWGSGRCTDNYGASWYNVGFMFSSKTFMPDSYGLIIDVVHHGRFIIHAPNAALWDSEYGTTCYRRTSFCREFDATIEMTPTGLRGWKHSIQLGPVVVEPRYRNDTIPYGYIQTTVAAPHTHAGDLYIVREEGGPRLLSVTNQPTGWTLEYRTHHIGYIAPIPLTFLESESGGTVGNYTPDEVDEANYSPVDPLIPQYLETLEPFGIPLPKILGLKLPGTYNVVYTYPTAVGTVTQTAPGVFGVPTTIAIPNANNEHAPEIVTVEIDVPEAAATTDPTGADAGYQVRIMRDPAKLSSLVGVCKELPADIKIYAYIPEDTNEPLGPQARVELGYQTLGLQAGFKGAIPSAFEITSRSTFGNLSGTATPSCGVNHKLNVVGSFKSPASGTDLTMKARMDALIQNWKLTTTKSGSTTLITYEASDFMKELSVNGTMDWGTQQLSIQNIPNRLVICSASSAACGVAWRRDMVTDGSLQFVATSSVGAYSPVTINAVMTEHTFTPTGFVTKTVTTRISNLVMSYLAFARKTSSAGGRFPKWIYLHTEDQVFQGNISIDSSSSGNVSVGFGPSRAVNRQLAMKWKNWWTSPKVQTSGSLQCGGMSFSASDFPSWAEGWLVDAFC